MQAEADAAAAEEDGVETHGHNGGCRRPSSCSCICALDLVTSEERFDDSNGITVVNSHSTTSTT